MKYLRKPVKNQRGPRSKIMLSAIKELIVIRSTTSPYVSDAGAVITDRQIIAEKLIEEIKEKYPGEIPPTEDTLLPKISASRNKVMSPLDKEFSLADLNNFGESGLQHISSEGIRQIMLIQEWLESGDNLSGNTHLSIRQARWVARLYATVAEKLSKPFGRTTIDIPKLQLYQVALIYAEQERVCEVSKTLFNTTSLDQGLRKGVAELIKAYTDNVGWEKKENNRNKPVPKFPGWEVVTNKGN